MEPVPVRCPACRREHRYRPPSRPCPCGARTAPAVLPGTPAVRITRPAGEDDRVTVRCEDCGRRERWTRPELCCPCGTVLRVPVRPAPDPGPDAAPEAPPRPAEPAHIPLPRTAPAPRPAFPAAPIRDPGDALATAARYLGWLGYHDVARPARPSAARIDLRATGVMAQVDTVSRPTAPRDVECLWLNALSAQVTGVLFSLSGYTPDAVVRADALGVPLFTMDTAGTPRPVNGPADELLSTGI
ncbi:hypothetical protein ABT097_00110 [Streptomyces sp. NPDC002225]|uniref:hypothetical protein n=1 Tax=Streptomyces sp. NPDC002225 TaxID=3154413 RepID=UPI00332CE68E